MRIFSRTLDIQVYIPERGEECTLKFGHYQGVNIAKLSGLSEIPVDLLCVK